MELRPHWKTRWLMIAILALPTLTWCAYSLLHPAAKKNGDKLYRLVEVPVHAEQALPSSPSSPWTMQESGTTAGLRGIDSVDGKIAWASGTGGTVLKTIDGGEHWQKCAVPDADKDGTTLDFRGVQAWDTETAIVMASGPDDKSRLYKTTDGCVSWTLLLKNPDKDGFWDAFSFHGNNGWLLGDPVNGAFSLFATSDGGKRWIQQHNKGLHADAARQGAFAASNSSLDAKFAYVLFGSGGKEGAFIYSDVETAICLDDCSSREMNLDGRKDRWAREAVPVGVGTESSGVFSMASRGDFDGAPLGSSSLVVVGGDYSHPDESDHTAAFKISYYKPWTASTKPPHGYRSSVAWSEGLKAWIAAGTNGSDISRDDGKTWQPLDDGNWNALSLPFVVGPKGRIARLSASASLPK
jgi:photosystem II stability/assembly factor-like uncharacterized protein